MFCTRSSVSPVPVGNTLSSSACARVSGGSEPKGGAFISGRSTALSMFRLLAIPSMQSTASRTPPGSNSRTTKS